MRLLVIEDEADLREAIVDELRVHGHVVRDACDGLEGWQLLHDENALPDVILLDLLMPKLDGHQFRVRQLADVVLAAIPTIVFTALNVDETTRASLGEVLLVPKPAGFATLLAAISAAVEPPGHPYKRCD